MRGKESQQYTPAQKLLEKLRERSDEALKKGGAFVVEPQKKGFFSFLRRGAFVEETARRHVTDDQIEEARQEMQRAAQLTLDQKCLQKQNEVLEGAKLLDPRTRVNHAFGKDRNIHVRSTNEVIDAIIDSLSPMGVQMLRTIKK